MYQKNPHWNGHFPLFFPNAVSHESDGDPSMMFEGEPDESNEVKVVERFSGILTLPIQVCVVNYPLETIIFSFKAATNGIKGTEAINMLWKKDSFKNDGYLRMRHQKFGYIDNVCLY